MISTELQHLITEKLSQTTNINDWVINGPEIEARECIIYKASSLNYPHAIAIKTYRQKQQKYSLIQHDVLERFSNSLNLENNGYYVPKVFGSFPDKGIFLMEWIESPKLEKRLWRYFYSKKHVQSDMRRSFKWLKEFHLHANLENQLIKHEKYKDTLNKFFKEHEGKQLLSNNEVFAEGRKCFEKTSKNTINLIVLHANLHGDFTPSNILIDDEKVTSIDMFGNQHLPVANDIALLLTYIAIEYPNMLTRYDFKLPPTKWPLLELIIESYGYPKDSKQLNFFLFVFLYQLLRRWMVINHRNKNKRVKLLEKWRLRNIEMIVKNLTKTLKK